MARGINKWIGVGNLGGDPETRYTQSGTPVASFSVATGEEWTDKQTGEKQQRTEWHNCVAWGKLAEIIGEYAKKGRQVYVEGSLRTDKYTDKQGIERYATKVIVDTFQLLGASDRGEGGGERRQGGNQGQQNRDHGSAPQRHQAPPPDMSGNQFDDDDIPF